MPNYTINIPAAAASDLVMALTQDWSPTLADGSVNPITRQQAASNAIAAMVRAQLFNYRQSIALQTADLKDPGITVQ